MQRYVRAFCTPVLFRPRLKSVSLESVNYVSRRRYASRPRASIAEEVSVELRSALKARDSTRLRALRGIRAAFLVAEKEVGSEGSLGDDRAVKELRRLAKMRRESITMFEAGGRSDLADAERAELEVIESWLPTQASEETTRAWAADAIEATGAKAKGDIGKVMGAVMKNHKDEVDGSLLRSIVMEMLK